MNQSVVSEIKNTNNTIDDNISNKDYLGRGLLSQNILAQLRNLVEDVIVLQYNKKNKKDLGVSFEDKRTAYKDLHMKNSPRFLSEFHTYLQSSKSHYTPDYNGAEMLMQKYYYYLLKLKEYVKKEFNIDILFNIKDYPIDNDKSLTDYYKKIANEIESITDESKRLDKARYYVEKIKPFYVNDAIYYEITLSTATDNMNKFDRMIAYSKYDILPNYAITISVVEREIELFSSKTLIKIINNWRVAIRSCEINNLLKIFNIEKIVKSNMIEYNNLMTFLTKKDMNLLNIALLPQSYYKKTLEDIGEAPTDYIFELLNESRKIILPNKCGSNTIRYLLYTMRNINIKKQLNRYYGENIPTDFLSNLCLKRKCYPFEKIPFVMSLADHTPNGEDLFLSISKDNCNDELLARHVLNNIEQKGFLYTPVEELNEYGNLDELITVFNKKLYGDQLGLKMVHEHNFVYMDGYENSTLEIINKINDLTNYGIEGYKESFEYWELLEGFSQNISEEKKKILRNLYVKSRVALIYGAAGTGKTTLISSLSEFFSERTKMFLANTNTAVENLQRRIKTKNSCFKTISEYNKKEAVDRTNDILIIDECSTVSNSDMFEILNNSKFSLLLLVGDVHQIESIRFGNWFNYCKNFINKNSIYELSETFRSNNEKLLELWKRVRNRDERILEYIVANKFSSELDESIFNKQDPDEIILCLGYDGLYGINQINKYLQDYNNSQNFNFGIKTFKVGDKVLFFDTKRFGNVLYNNLKGTIVNIVDNEKEMYFEIEIEKPLIALDVINSYVNLIETKQNSSIISFTIDKEFENDDDDDDKNNIVPFNIAYALSIHKAQGLEYNSVKVVLTKDIEKMISPNIFYTAITRAKKDLKIFWTVESAQSIIGQIKKFDNTRDFNIFKNKYSDVISSHII